MREQAVVNPVTGEAQNQKKVLHGVAGIFAAATRVEPIGQARPCFRNGCSTTLVLTWWHFGTKQSIGWAWTTETSYSGDGKKKPHRNWRCEVTVLPIPMRSAQDGLDPGVYLLQL